MSDKRSAGQVQMQMRAFEESMRRSRVAMEAFTAAIYRNFVTVAIIDCAIELPWGDRISALRRSPDRRQRKRGNRLALQWMQRNGYYECRFAA